MNRWLAGTASAAAVVLAGLAGWVLFGPGAPPPAAPDGTAPPAAARIAEHARALVRGAHGVQYVGTEESLARPRQGYQVTFRSAEPELARARDDAANAARRAAWQRRFCTDELKGEMAAQGVTVVTGRVVDGSGRTQHVADCMAGGGATQQAGPGGPLL